MMNVKIGYLIQSYADSKALKKLIALLLRDPDCGIFVHVDKKSNINDFLVNDTRVHFIQKRELVSWAGYKQGKLIFNLIEEAVQCQEKFDWYCFLSESDFPVSSGEELIQKILRTKNIMLNCSRHQKNKVERYWFYDFNLESPKANKFVSKIVNGIFGVLYQWGVLKKENRVYLDGEKVEVYFSGPFWKYDQEQLCYINDVYQRNIKFQQYFKHSFAPCELMVSTIIANSPYKDECRFEDAYINLNQLSGLCYFKYTGSRVDVLGINDYDDIIKSEKPFIRKVNESYSKELIDKLTKIES